MGVLHQSIAKIRQSQGGFVGKPSNELVANSLLVPIFPKGGISQKFVDNARAQTLFGFPSPRGGMVESTLPLLSDCHKDVGAPVLNSCSGVLS